MNMRPLLFSLFLFFAPGASFAKKKSSSKKPIREVMRGVNEDFNELIPYLVSEAEFSKNENRKNVAKYISSMKNSFATLKDHPTLNVSGLILNRDVMNQQLEQVESMYKESKFDFARYKLLSDLNLCIGCHMQSSEKNIGQVLPNSNSKVDKLGVFERAEYFYITRKYEDALRLYDEYIMSFKKIDDDEKLFKSFERKLNYFIRLKRDYKEAKISLEANLKNKDLPNRMRAEVNDWLKTLVGTPLWENFDSKKATEDEMGAFLKTFIKDEDGPIFTITDSTEVLDMDLASILLEYYNAHPETKHGAKILYWMSLIDKRLNDDLFYSLGDLYLVQCIEKYPNDPIAKDCFESYMENLEFIYLSKEKKKFPKEIQKRLDELKKLVNYQEEK